MNTDGPSFIDPETGLFVLTLPDWEAIVTKVRELEIKVQTLEKGIGSK